MPTDELRARFESILSGQLSGAELVIGLVGAVGASLGNIVKDLKKCFEKYEYSTQEIHVSDLISDLTEVQTEASDSKFHRTDALMTAGDKARETTGENAILGLSAVNEIYGQREKDENNENKVKPRPRRAYIINSLKHPDEVSALRRIYGSGFFLVGVYVEPEKRKILLVRNEGMSDDEADRLMRRDEAEGPTHGQRTRDTFHLSDFFVHLMVGDHDEAAKTQATLERFLDLIFADFYRTPLFDEHAMFLAFATATRSADLSRQIGAVIARDNEILAMGANECPQTEGGTYWPYLDKDNHVVDFEKGRDYKLGHDTNNENKARIIDDAVREMKNAWDKKAKEKEGKDTVAEMDWDLLKTALESSAINDITEYGRVVHAEMDALLACARNGTSCRGATLYTTTYPCHNCAKHIIAAGIKRVVYVEPYPKSKALEFHQDSAFAGFESKRQKGDSRVVFEPFVGVGPRRFLDLFSMKQSSGFPLKRKDETTGKVLTWDSKTGIMRIPELPWNYLEREGTATNILEKYLKGESDVQSRAHKGATTQTDAGSEESVTQDGI